MKKAEIKDEMIGQIMGNLFRIESKIGEGSFGMIWKAVHNKSKLQVAIKTEDAKNSHDQLMAEYKIYQWLHSSPQISQQPIPQVYYYGVEGNHNILVMDLLGYSLHHLFYLVKKYKKQTTFSLKTVLMIADQTLQRLEFIHSMRLIHRDIKPGNIMVGKKPHKHRLFLIDFGLAKKYKSENGTHLPFKVGKSMVGTARYCSLNTSLGHESSRKDDLETLFFCFMFFLKGKLPWMGFNDLPKNERYEMMKQIKKDISIEEICDGAPEEFEQFLTYVRELPFEADPSYNFLRGLFKNLMSSNKWAYDNKYDWSDLV